MRAHFLLLTFQAAVARYWSCCLLAWVARSSVITGSLTALGCSRDFLRVFSLVPKIYVNLLSTGGCHLGHVEYWHHQRRKRATLGLLPSFLAVLPAPVVPPEFVNFQLSHATATTPVNFSPGATATTPTTFSPGVLSPSAHAWPFAPVHAWPLLVLVIQRRVLSLFWLLLRFLCWVRNYTR